MSRCRMLPIAVLVLAGCNLGSDPETATLSAIETEVSGELAATSAARVPDFATDDPFDEPVESEFDPGVTLTPSLDPDPFADGSDGTEDAPLVDTGLQTYTNTANGYQFQYPSSSVVTEVGGQQRVLVNNQIEIAVQPVNPENAQGAAPVIDNAVDTTVGGLPARALVGMIGAVGGNTPQSYQSVVIPYNGQYLTITVYELPLNTTEPETREIGAIPEPALRVYEQIVDTFQFTGG